MKMKNVQNDTVDIHYVTTNEKLLPLGQRVHCDVRSLSVYESHNLLNLDGLAGNVDILTLHGLPKLHELRSLSDNSIMAANGVVVRGLPRLRSLNGISTLIDRGIDTTTLTLDNLQLQNLETPGLHEVDNLRLHNCTFDNLLH